ncbi:MAG: FprA family A-type flavoprotein [Anaerotignum propionicum]|uniref:FprA family A-type flavoprotein n=1 Tax=Anaerotignum propionicum TaxID=28446 RepID=UPI002B210AA2|nr:FprA family A-type flavoprotein [Anaerotignum propionicum]MEA5058359.1 FprA family A-type flavoprotein [Anaerotignum propionicum]
MYCLKKITDDLIWVGGNDRRLAMFEGVYSVPDGVSYNSYLMMDEKTVLFDTVDKAVSKVFFENLTEVLGERPLDYLVVHHMEPDHSFTLEEVVLRYPNLKIICNSKIVTIIKQFFDFDIDSRAIIVKEGEELSTGKHQLKFYMAPMVHWPEVMMTYDTTDGILFSADAFGCFGALNGAIFADEVDFQQNYMEEARRYYSNIIGKYGSQVQAVLKKIVPLEIRLLCPLHGFVWRKDIEIYLEKYDRWSSYTPEEEGVVIAYASIYGNTENAAEILASRLWDRGIKAIMFDVSVTHASDIITAAFRYSHLVFASTTYNNGIFVSMEALIFDIVAHNLQNRTIAVIENGSWAPNSGKLIRTELEKCKNMNILENKVSIKSTLKKNQLSEIDAMVDTIAETLLQKARKSS